MRVLTTFMLLSLATLNHSVAQKLTETQLKALSGDMGRLMETERFKVFKKSGDTDIDAVNRCLGDNDCRVALACTMVDNVMFGDFYEEQSEVLEQMLKPLADKGNHPACALLGYVYSLWPQGIRCSEALKYLDVAVGRKDSWAMVTRARIRRGGQCGSADLSAALSDLEQAMQLKDTVTFLNAAIYLRGSKGFDHDRVTRYLETAYASPYTREDALCEMTLGIKEGWFNPRIRTIGHYKSEPFMVNEICVVEEDGSLYMRDYHPNNAYEETTKRYVRQ